MKQCAHDSQVALCVVRVHERLHRVREIEHDDHVDALLVGVLAADVLRAAEREDGEDERRAAAMLGVVKWVLGALLLVVAACGSSAPPSAKGPAKPEVREPPSPLCASDESSEGECGLPSGAIA